MTESIWREPRFSAKARERKALHDLARQRAGSDPRVQQYLADVRGALDAFLGHLASETWSTDVGVDDLARFTESIAAAAAAAAMVAPTLYELAAPIHDQLPILQCEIALGVIEDRIERDDHPGAHALREALRRGPGTLTFVAFKRSLSELRQEAGIDRAATAKDGSRRGRPAGNKKPRASEEDVKSFIAQLRPVVDELRRNGYDPTVRKVATFGGWDERRLREAFAEHGIKAGVLFRMLRKDAPLGLTGISRRLVTVARTYVLAHADARRATTRDARGPGPARDP